MLVKSKMSAVKNIEKTLPPQPPTPLYPLLQTASNDHSSYDIDDDGWFGDISFYVNG